MFKVGDKVALVDTPDQLWGTVVRVDSRNDLADIEVTDPDGRKWFSRLTSAGHVISGKWKEMQVVPYAEPAPPEPPAPKFLATARSGGGRYTGDSINFEGPCAFIESADGGFVSLLNGDAVYKLVGRVEVKTITEEDVPVTPGYRYSVSDFRGGHEVEVVAIRGDYAFIQSYNSEGVAQGCTTVRVSSIPKTKRPCNKTVKQLTKE